MIIGVDVDGVLTDMFSYVDSESKVFEKKYNISAKRKEKGINFIEFLGWTEEQDALFWDEVLFDYGKKVVMKSGAKETIQKLKDQGHMIYIITARAFCTSQTERGETSRKILYDWFKDNDIYYDKMIFTKEGESKVPQVLENNIDIFIDDTVKNIQEIGDVNIPVICMDEPYNQTFEHENMVRCQTWDEVFEIINKFDKENKIK